MDYAIAAIVIALIVLYVIHREQQPRRFRHRDHLIDNIAFTRLKR